MNKENIMFFFDDKNEDKLGINELDMNELMKEFDLIDTNPIIHITVINKTIDNYSVNELQQICEYYGLLKNIKMAKYKKTDIINAIKCFEIDETNKNIVDKRIKLWGYMDELLSDKIMKKYIIWK
jgi:hypothetical protein